MDKWGLQKENCTQFVHDSGSNMVSAAELLEFHHTPCLAHELHLVVSGALSKQTKSFETELPAWSTLVSAEVNALTTDHAGDDELTAEERVEMEHLRDLAIDEMLDFTNRVLEDLEKDAMASMREKVQSFRSLSVYFRRSAKGHNRLADIQKKNGGTKAVNMIVDCPTRWNSCFDMLQRSLKLQGALDGFFQHLHTEEGQAEFKDMSKKLTKPIHKDWLAIDCLTVLLKLFASVSSMLGAQEYPTLPLVMSALDAIEDVLGNSLLLESKLNGACSEEYVEEVRVLMSGVQSTVLRVFKKRFDKLKSTELDWIAFLDPRVAKTMNHVRPGKMKETQEKFLDAVMELGDATVTPRSERRSRTPMNSPDPISDRMFGCRAPDDESPIERRCREEIVKYLDAAKALVVPRQPQDFDTLAWWSVNKSTYPNISRLARKWLGAVATRVPSERACSVTGNIITAKQSSLAPEFVRDLIFIAENSRRMKTVRKTIYETRI